MITASIYADMNWISVSVVSVVCSLQAKSHIKKFAFSDNREAAKSVAFTLSMYFISIALFPFVRGTLFRYALAFFGGMVNTRAFAVFHDCNHGKHIDWGVRLK
jgi:hypothetical protein